MVTRAQFSGNGIRPDGVPTYGESAGSVISTRLALPWRNVNRRTRSPTETASSTSADMIRGVETLTSTPQASVKSHSLLGWLTRPTVRGTPNSVFASSEVTRLTLSSPVAAITTSQRSSRASSSEESSHESASSHSASGTRSGLIESGFLSISRTWWPLWISSRAMERPTAPAPAMATRMTSSALVRAGFDDLVGPGGVLLAHGDVKDVALLDHAVATRQHAFAETVDPGDPALRRDLVDPDGARGVAEVRFGSGRQDPAQHLVGGPLDRRHRGDAQTLVDLGAARVVDPGDDLLDSEGLTGHPRGDDVGVVAARHRGEGIGATDAGLLQDL